MSKKTKIVCTIGPACSSISILKQMIENGMNVARLNFSHGSHETHRETYESIRSAAKESGKEIAIMQDLQGPKIRIGDLNDHTIELHDNDVITLSSDHVFNCDEKIIPLPHPDVIRDIQIGETLLIDDGLLEIKVTDKIDSSLVCSVIRGGELKQKKGVNLPATDLKLPALTEKDRKDLVFGLHLGVDAVALSFVRSAADILDVKKVMEQENIHVPVIAKIEKPQAVENIREILEVSYGIMIARGDLGVEMPYAQAPLIQKKIIALANEYAKPVITATQMLDSMKENAIPTRAETTDVANSILDGTDAVMLSQETATGKYPVKSVAAMKNIAMEIEQHFSYETWTDTINTSEQHSVSHALAHAACMVSERIKAHAIFAHTMSGATALRIAKFKPRCPIIALSPDKRTARILNFSFGIYGYHTQKCTTSDELFDMVNNSYDKYLSVDDTDVHFVITAGMPVSYMKETNLIRTLSIKK